MLKSRSLNIWIQLYRNIRVNVECKESRNYLSMKTVSFISLVQRVGTTCHANCIKDKCGYCKLFINCIYFIYLCRFRICEVCKAYIFDYSVD